jgi:phage terminase large subunit GpA-like protein
MSASNANQQELTVETIMHRALPCPFCGNKANYRQGHEHSYIGGHDTTVYIECSHCPAEMSGSFGQNGQKIRTEIEAVSSLVDDWNSRT